MPLYGASNGGKRKKSPRQRESAEWMTYSSCMDEDGCVLTLTRLSLLSLADNMNTLWVKDYAEKYLDQYLFRHIMGPFNVLCAELVEELIQLLCTRKKLSRGALDLLLVPQLRTLSLGTCPGLATTAVCTQIAARCQLLFYLDISGAQQLSSKALSQMLPCLPKLRSLSLAGTASDKSVIRAVVQNCPLLRHLDVSRCHFLTPAALLLLGASSCLSSPESSPSTLASCSTSTVYVVPHLPLNSLLALDIGFEEQEGDAVAVAAYLLLTLSGLEKLAIEGLAQACQLILLGNLDQTEKFTAKERVPRLEDVWKERMQGQDNIGLKNNKEARKLEKNEYCKDDASESEEDSTVIDARICPTGSRDHLTLRLKNVRVLSCDALISLGHLCPNITYISVNADYPDTIQRHEVEHLTKAVETFSGQLKSLSIQYSGLVDNLCGTVHAAGSSLLSLTLEGVKTSQFSHVYLLRVLQSCPRLTELSISAEHTHSAFQLHSLQVVIDDRIDWNLLNLLNLCMLTLRFSYEHDQMKPNTMLWIHLKAILRCLLARSPLLQKMSLVSLPCPLDSVLQEVLHISNIHQFDSLPLRCLQQLDLQRTDVQMTTVNDLIKQNKRLKYVDVRHCWNISHSESIDCARSGNVEVVWV